MINQTFSCVARCNEPRIGELITSLSLFLPHIHCNYSILFFLSNWRSFHLCLIIFLVYFIKGNLHLMAIHGTAYIMEWFRIKNVNHAKRLLCACNKVAANKHAECLANLVVDCFSLHFHIFFPSITRKLVKERKHVNKTYLRFHYIKFAYIFFNVTAI